MSLARPEVAVGAVAVVDGALLLVQRGTPPEAGRWTIPGGRVEAGEPLAAAVEREVAEETGLAVHCDRFLGWAERIGADHHFVILDFAVSLGPPPSGDPPRRDRAGRPPPRAGGDAAAARWVPLHAVVDDTLVEGLGAFLRDHGIAVGIRR